MDGLRKSKNVGNGPEEDVKAGSVPALVINGAAIGLFVRRR